MVSMTLTFSFVCDIERIVSEKKETQRTTFILCNVWVLRCMACMVGPSFLSVSILSPYSPAWHPHRSMIFFVILILTFVWRSDSTTDPAIPSPLSPSAALGPRIAVSAFFLLGQVYFTAIVKRLQWWAAPGSPDRSEGPRASREGRE